MTVRSAARDDARAIAALLGELGYPSTAQDVESRLARLSDRPDADVLVAELDGAPVGVAAYAITDLLERAEPQCRVTALVTAGAQRRRGIATALLDRVEAMGRERGCFRLEVTTRPDRAEAAGLYDARGFEERPRRLVKELASGARSNAPDSSVGSA